ncbi:MAG: hypothetical protein ACM3O4_01340 [Ignavibacteriales bacterium]
MDATILKNLKGQSITMFLKNTNCSLPSSLDENQKIKLCSTNKFGDTIEYLSQKYINTKYPTVLAQVSGFYETASLVGKMISTRNKKTKPFLLFFDRNPNSIQNAIFNSLLINISDNNREFLTLLFGLKKVDIVKAFTPKKYQTYINDAYKEQIIDSSLSTEEKDQIIEGKYLSEEIIKTILEEKFSFNKLFDYIKELPKYNAESHYNQLLTKANQKLSKEMLELFKQIAHNICNHLELADNYQNMIKDLSESIKVNGKNHILNNNETFSGYKSMLLKSGSGNVKFLPGIDINTPEGLKELEKILKSYNIISDQEDPKDFSVDIAIVPKIRMLKNAYPFIKKTVQDYVMSSDNTWGTNSTATLNVYDYKSIGAEFIEEERNNRKKLTHLKKINSVKGFPLISFIAGANFGNIYHSEVDTQNMIDMAIADGVDTIYIQGLFYSTYYHNQTSRRMLIDPEYETLDSRLKAAKKIIQKLNKASIKVVYQMGDEEKHLYEDMFKIYTREQGVKGDNFLERKDLRTRYDWVRPIIIQQLIPYLIRSGEDVTNFYTDEAEETRISELCHALKLYYEGHPLGDLSKYINPKYLEDTDMFKVVYSTIDNYDLEDPSLSIELISNPNYSHLTQYAKPDTGVKKHSRLLQTGTIGDQSLERIPQILVDGRQGHMAIAYQGGQTIINVPQMIRDAWYKNPDLLLGIKDKIAQDPTHKRITQPSTKPNSPGGWTITGDAREIMSIIPYYKRVREVLEYVQKTGKALPELNVLHMNDIQLGSPTERIEYFVKMLDVAFYKYNIKGIWGNGDFQQGWNYPKFANESRHLGSMSVSQQMIDFVELQRPFLQEGFGVVKAETFETKDSKKRIKINSINSNAILSHLANNYIIETQKGLYGNVHMISKNIDYKKVNLKLPPELKEYEKDIREKLCSINRLWFYHMVEGNHEYNTDWNNKGYKLIEHLKQELDNYKTFTGSDLEVVLTEYFVNKEGDFVNAPYGFKTINGYNIVYGHAFKSPGKGSGNSPIMAMANYFEQMGDQTNGIHRAFEGHYHTFETAVINNMMLSITGGSAGQSGYEQNLGYHSRPLYVVDRYLADGRIVTDTIGTEFLKSWKIKNPYIAEKGLENFIQECLTEKASIYGPDEPKDIQKIYTRKLVPSKPNNRIGPKI